jgi:hypothetical protein
MLSIVCWGRPSVGAQRGVFLVFMLFVLGCVFTCCLQQNMGAGYRKSSSNVLSACMSRLLSRREFAFGVI